VAERYFFALWPGDEQRLALTQMRGELPPYHGREAHPEDLHVTLVFLGQLDEERRRCVEAAAERVRGTAFSLTLDRIGSFPRARILWCGAGQTPQRLLELVGGLQGELRECGFRPERRAFVAHVTLARKSRPLPASALDHRIDWPVDSFVLAVGRDGGPPRYRVLRRWALAS
jgi:2'-5' RNA ligase